MDVYDLIIALMSFAPGIGPPIIAACIAVGTLVGAVSAGLGAARVFVKLTFWTKKDDEFVERFEKRFKKVTEGRLKPLFVIIDRLSVLKNTVR